MACQSVTRFPPTVSPVRANLWTGRGNVEGNFLLSKKRPAHPFFKQGKPKFNATKKYFKLGLSVKKLRVMQKRYAFKIQLVQER